MGVFEWPAVGSSAFSSPLVELTTCKGIGTAVKSLHKGALRVLAALWPSNPPTRESLFYVLSVCQGGQQGGGFVSYKVGQRGIRNRGSFICPGTASRTGFRGLCKSGIKHNNATLGESSLQTQLEMQRRNANAKNRLKAGSRPSSDRTNQTRDAVN